MSKLFLATMLLSGIASAQTAGFNAVNAFPLRQNGPSIHRHVEAGAPFTVAGARGVVLGQQQGTFEAWVLPVKLLSHFRISARLKDYPVPIDLNSDAAEISVFPDHTVITYSHIAFTVRQIMFSLDDAPAGTGTVVGLSDRLDAPAGPDIQLHAGIAANVAQAHAGHTVRRVGKRGEQRILCAAHRLS